MNQKWRALLLAPLLLAACKEDLLKPEDKSESALSAKLEIAPTPGAAWVARHNMTSAAYQTEFNKWVGLGYRLTYISGYSVGAEERFAALWEKSSGPAWIARHGMTNAQYQAEFNTQSAAGYRLVLVNGYSVNNQDRYVAIWQQAAGPALIARHGMTNAQYQAQFNAQLAAGYRLVHVSGYAVNNVDYYAAIWTKASGPAWIARHGMTSAQYQQEFNADIANGYRLTDVSGYGLNGADYYAAIFEKVSSGPWQARHAMNAAQYQQTFSDLYYQGYRPSVVSGFTVNGTDRYAAIWENYAFSSSTLSSIDNIVNGVMNTTHAPAVSLAITKNGRLVFAKAYGVSDKSANTPAHTSDRFRIASVSKPITSVSLMKLTEMKKADGVTPLLNLESKVFGTGAILGNTYGTSANYSANLKAVRVRHLMSHTEGGWPNDGTDPMFNPSTINDNQAQLIGWTVDNRPLSTPGLVSSYSNFGYCILGRVIEKLTGQNYAAWVKSNILAPAGITDMEIAGDTQAERKPNEVVYYDASPTAPYDMKVARMDSHGGWIATPIALTRLLVKVDGFASKPDMLSSASIASMTAPWKAGESYAKGWAVNTSGNWWHGGSLPGTTSEIARIHDLEVNWAVVTNTRDNNPNLDQMMWDIMSAVPTWPTHDLF